MPILTDTDLQGFSDMAVDLALKDTCDILRERRIQQPSGGSTLSWDPPLATAVPCAIIDMRTPDDQVIGSQRVGEMRKIALLPRLTDCLANDRLRIAGVLYEVIDLFDPSSYEVLRRVLVRRFSIA